jgi:tyrosyl-tRNA synthetase
VDIFHGGIAASLAAEHFRSVFQRHALPSDMPDLELRAPTSVIDILTHAGLVSTAQEGRFVRCHAVIDRIDDLVGFLTDDCCGGHPEICKPR